MKTHITDDPNEVCTVAWVGDKTVRRSGLRGRILDALLGAKVIPGPNQFIATRSDGTVVTSPDGITWTLRTTPERDQ